MAKTTRGRERARKVVAWSAVLAAPVALVALSSATASAKEMGVDRTVNSRQAGSVSGDATFGEVRGARGNGVYAQGEIKESMKAVPDRLPGTRARPFNPNWKPGPGMGGW
ncbi:hypothetical protein ACNUDN_07435 [Mycobacterium sp. smrl_JER01]|uniref:hypothetical protein n=1 Tax=Mycobacterium sp. smrl_JER01 TaxID=3402633 RepID=UPI003AC08B34